MLTALAQPELADANPRDAVQALLSEAITTASGRARSVAPTAPQTRAQSNARTVGRKRFWTAEKALELAVLACLVGGAVGVLKALQMEHAGDALLCLFGSLGTCGFVSYLYFGPGSATTEAAEQAVPKMDIGDSV